MRKKNPPLTIGLAYEISSDYKLKPDDPDDTYYEFDTPEIINGYALALKKNGYKISHLGNFKQIVANLDKIKNTVDLVFNNSEGLTGRNRESQVPMILEYADIPFTGSDALTMSVSLDKVITKYICIAHKIPTPDFEVCESIKNLPKLKSLKFPLIVKPRWEGSSKGISPNAVVHSKSDLKKQIIKIINNYHQPALIEAFIAGHEYTVGIIGNGKNIQILPIVEILIDGKAVLKKVYSGRYVYSNDVKYDCPAKINSQQKKQISSLALEIYNAIGCRDIGRVDFRVDDLGNPFVLEVNTIPALSQSDAFGVIAKYMKWSYQDLIGKIITTARKRYSL